MLFDFARRLAVRADFAAADFDLRLAVAIWLSLERTTASCAATDKSPGNSEGRRGWDRYARFWQQVALNCQRRLEQILRIVGEAPRSPSESEPDGLRRRFLRSCPQLSQCWRFDRVGCESLRRACKFVFRRRRLP